MKSSGVYAFASLMGWDMATVANALGTTSATLSRCKSKSLSSQTSEHAIEVARLSMVGINYFGNIENWNAWLNTAHIQFNSRAPRLVLNSIRGRELIKNVIKQLQYGFTA
ncbi:antitoxin Xre/MbcA/ParS toxin-binding domain-containing protein [Pseudoalteromonas sp. BZK2]|uniref:antitoxin Xre/MbcA/ParS toxin-binding domain-containing protein n=1 Tax=Pseudoalteromonas sp. BZK2 TaxID=1904458 RepID=UPI0021CD1435|nr:antitoxin Xre/MbcA/ParS toxin-binding domain-containing protein [Pseudoalteromonas sp. BZK2]